MGRSLRGTRSNKTQKLAPKKEDNKEVSKAIHNTYKVLIFSSQNPPPEGDFNIIY